jgi:photosystem II stability/assembly factor-like uncharacterized protein
VHPTNADIVEAITSRGGFGRDSQEAAPSPPPFGVLKSSDGGATWTRTLAGQATALEIDPTNFDNQYAAIGDVRTGIFTDSPGSALNGVYRSVDGGQTWVPIPGPWGTSTISRAATGRIELAIAPSNPGVLYVSIAVAPNGGSSGQPLLGLYRTSNAWAPVPAWVQIPTEPTGTTGYCGPQKCNYSHVISVDPSDENRLFAGGGERTELWQCGGCGTTPVWTNTAAGSGVHPDFHAMAWAGKRLIAGNDGGVWSLASPESAWQSHNATISTNMFFSGALHPKNPDFILGGLRDFSVSLRTGASTWLNLPEPLVDANGNRIIGGEEWGEGEVAISSSQPDTNWMANHCCEGTIYRTTNGGSSGIAVEGGIDTTGVAFVAPVRKCPTNDDVFVTGSNRLWRINDFFSSASPSWVPNSPASPFQFPNPNALVYPGTVLAIEFAPSDNSCNTYAYGIRGGQLQLTRDGGRTWTDLDSLRTLPPRPLNGIAFDPVDPNVVYAAFSSFDDATPGKPSHVFKTVNALAQSPNWADISPLLNQPFNVIRVDPVNSRRIYAGSDTGLWHSSDSGANWVHDGLDVGLPNAPVYDIQINPKTGRTVIFTYGRGAFTLGPELFSITPSPDGGVTYAAGPLVPGAWALVRGAQLAGATLTSDPSNPSANINGVEVQVNGIPAPIYAISPNQIAFQVPADVTGTARIQVLRDGIPSNNLNGDVVQPAAVVRPVASRIVPKRLGRGRR